MSLARLRVMLFLALAGMSVAAGLLGAPNFVVLMGEAQGWSSMSMPMDDRNLASASAWARTPNLDRLAREGVRFPNFVAASPRCTPTRAALLTGRSPAALRMTYVGESRGPDGRTFSTGELGEDSTTIAELLRGAGYATAHFGKWHVGRKDPSRHGFEESSGPTANGGPENVANPNPKQAFASLEKAKGFVRRSVAAGRPFLLQVSQYAGKSMLDARPETYAAVEARLGARGRAVAGSVAVAEDADATYGELLGLLDELGVAGSTYVIYTSDHGSSGRNPPFSGGKGTVGEGGLRVPLLVRGPGIPAGRVAQAQATTVDLFPTLAGLAGVSTNGCRGLEGVGLEAVLRDPERTLPARAFPGVVVHFPHRDRGEDGPATAYYLDGFKLVWTHEDGVKRLYDLRVDPGEANDLATREPARLDSMGRRLEDYLRSVGAAMPPAGSVGPERRGGPRRGGR